jgi:hypothetical protein
MADAAGATAPSFWCPHCDGAPLARDGVGFTCAGCGTRFPLLAGIPWLFAEPGQRLAEWRQRLALLLREYESQGAALRAEADAQPAGTTRRRLARTADAMRSHLGCLERLLRPLAALPDSPRRETLLALRTRLPLAQDLTSYYVNLHRDWVWGEAENAAALEIVGALLEGSRRGNWLIAGSGAGRLAWDLHQSLQPTSTLAVDLNPLLQLVASALARGEGVELWEFPLAPRDLDDFAIARTLRAPAATRPGLQFVLADALRAPLARGACDAVVTPWFIDIVPQPLGEAAARVNRLLPPGGSWVNFGSLSFSQGGPAQWLSKQEVLECVAAAGFEVVASREDELPYMRSPASRHSRTERTFAFRAVKRSDAADPGPAWNLPEWLADPALPVPRLAHFETQGLVTRIYAFVLALVDGRRSTREIAAYLVEQKLMDAADAEAAVRSFLTQLYEEGRRRTRF